MNKRTLKIVSSLVTILVILGFGGLAFGAVMSPEDIAEAARLAAVQEKAMKAQGLASNYGLIAIAAGFGLGLAALGGGLGQGRAAAAALDGIARNPGAAGQIRGPMILGLALIESLVIYALIIGFILVGKIS